MHLEEIHHFIPKFRDCVLNDTYLYFWEGRVGSVRNLRFLTLPTLNNNVYDCHSERSDESLILLQSLLKLQK